MAKQEATVQYLVDQIEAGRLKLPEMQREYVWKSTQVRDLLDSLYRGYPSGVILAWQTDTDVVTTNFAVETEKSAADTGLLLLDGQQRLTSLSAVLRGELVQVRNHKKPIDILFNLDHPDSLLDEGILIEEGDSAEDFDSDSLDEDDSETEEDLQAKIEKFTFVVASSSIRALRNWVSVTEVFKSSSDKDFLKAAGVKGFEDPRYDKYSKRLERLRSIKDYVYRIDILEKHLSYEEVTEIFVRVNSAGSKLRASDLALAQITSKWRGSLQGFRDFKDQCADNQFDLDLGIHLRALVAFATGQCKFLTASSIGLDALQSSWQEAKKGLQFAINFCRSNCKIDRPVLLSSPMVLIALAYWGHLRNFSVSTEEEITMRRWVLIQNLKGHYARGSSETILNQDLAVIRNGGGPKELLDSLLIQVGRFDVTPEELIGRSTNGGIFKTMFLVFKADGASDWKTGIDLAINHAGNHDRIEFHHIFPKASLQSHFGNQISKGAINDIANLAFIGGETNRQIGAKPAGQYLLELSKSEPERLKKQQIPLIENLFLIEKYEEFKAARRQMISSRINEFIK